MPMREGQQLLRSPRNIVSSADKIVMNCGAFRLRLADNCDAEKNTMTKNKTKTEAKAEMKE